MKKTTWPGNWKVVCDVCGFQYPSGEIKERWDGLLVCPTDWETRHPQDLIRLTNNSRPIPFARPEPEPNDTQGFCDVATLSAYTGLAAVGCAQVGNNTVPYLILRDMFLSGHE